MKLDRAVNSKQLAAETRSMPHILMHQMRALSGFLFEAALLLILMSVQSFFWAC